VSRAEPSRAVRNDREWENKERSDQGERVRAWSRYPTDRQTAFPFYPDSKKCSQRKQKQSTPEKIIVLYRRKKRGAGDLPGGEEIPLRKRKGSVCVTCSPPPSFSSSSYSEDERRRRRRRQRRGGGIARAVYIKAAQAVEIDCIFQLFCSPSISRWVQTHANTKVLSNHIRRTMRINSFTVTLLLGKLPFIHFAVDLKQLNN